MYAVFCLIFFFSFLLVVVFSVLSFFFLHVYAPVDVLGVSRSLQHASFVVHFYADTPPTMPGGPFSLLRSLLYQTLAPHGCSVGDAALRALFAARHPRLVPDLPPTDTKSPFTLWLRSPRRHTRTTSVLRGAA